MPMDASRIRVLIALLACIAFVAGSATDMRSASADETLIHPSLREFFRVGRYDMYINGSQQSTARIYQSRRAGAFLVTGSSYGKPLLLQPREKLVSTVPAEQIAERPDKGLDVVRGAKIEKLGELRIDRGGMAISIEGLRARLQPQPHLIGPKNAEQVILHSPEYGRAATSYRPRAADIQRIRSANSEFEVIVVFGTWCPTCTRLLPRILKVDEAIAGSKIKITYYGLAKKQGGRSDPAGAKFGVTRVPTAIVMVNGRNRGQISSKNLTRPERAIASLVR